MNNSFGERLKKLRKSCGFTQDDIAETLGINRSTYSGYENNKSIPDARTCSTLAKIYGITIDALIGSDRLYTPLQDSSKPTIKRNPDNTIDIEKVQSLTKEERRLICLFRAATDTQKNELLQEAAEFFKDNP